MLGDKKKNPQHSKKFPSLLSKILGISYSSIVTFLWTLCREMLLCSIRPSWHPHTMPRQPAWCMPGSGAHLLRDPAEAGSDPWDPHPHPSWHLQVLPGLLSTPAHPKRAATLQLGVDRLSRHLQSSQNSYRDSTPQEFPCLPSLVSLHQAQAPCQERAAPGWKHQDGC